MTRVYDCNLQATPEQQAAVGSDFGATNPYATAAVSTFPDSDLRPSCPPIYDQGQLGACTGFASTSMNEILRRIAGLISPRLSPLDVYYWERAAERTVSQDAGAALVDAAYVMLKRGAATIADVPYDIANFTVTPNAAAILDEGHYKLLTATHLHTIQDMLHCLASGSPFMGGFEIFEGPEGLEGDTAAKTGMLAMPLAGAQSLGGHALCVVGADIAKQILIVRNSWGEDWGDHGYFYMPFEYAIKFGSDFWTGTVETAKAA